jgi:hypothetical protein
MGIEVQRPDGRFYRLVELTKSHGESRNRIRSWPSVRVGVCCYDSYKTVRHFDAYVDREYPDRGNGARIGLSEGDSSKTSKWSH